MRWDAATYGRSFAPVYDSWYGTRGDEKAVVASLGGSAAHGSLLELGVGTGRLAIPLAASGWRVSGVDASDEMLSLLATKCAAAAVSVEAILDDAADPDGPAWPSVDVVVAAYNFLFNLPTRAAQLSCLRRAAATGATRLVVEAFVPDPAMTSGPTEVVLDDGTVVRTVVDVVTASITGCHRGPDGIERPWRVCVMSPDALDALARRAGWRLVERHADWAGSPYVTASSASHVSWYRSESAPPDPISP